MPKGCVVEPIIGQEVLAVLDSNNNYFDILSLP